MGDDTRQIRSLYVASAVTIGSGNDTQVGGDIPMDKVRKVIGIVISAAAAQRLEIMLGDSSDNDASTLMILNLPADTVEPVGSFDPDKPILICRPQQAAGGSTNTLNELAIAHETSAIDCTFVYYDE